MESTTTGETPGDIEDGTRPNWLKELKVGDKVIVSQCLNGYISKVEHLTDTRIIVGGRRYFKKNGGLVGANSYQYRLVKPTKRKLDNIYRLRASQKLEVISWTTVPLKKLQKILKILQDPA